MLIGLTFDKSRIKLPLLMENITKVTITAPAKVNFYLRVLRKRPDGYHDLDSFMQALELSDTVTVSRAGSGIEVSCDRGDVPAGPGNIAYRAAESLLGLAGEGAGVRIHIEKRIPVAAGLGGGSSDAAAVLRGMNILFGLGLTDALLREAGRPLGADVPFFLSWPSARAEGVGEVLTATLPPEETWLVLVNPGFSVSTAWVYGNLKLVLTNISNSIRLPASEGQAYGAGLLALCLDNDLERVTAERYPEINEIKGQLISEGAKGALMSGSGPTVFGVFADRAVAEAACKRISRPGWTVLTTRTIKSWPSPVVSGRL